MKKSRSFVVGPNGVEEVTLLFDDGKKLKRVNITEPSNEGSKATEAHGDKKESGS